MWVDAGKGICKQIGTICILLKELRKARWMDGQGAIHLAFCATRYCEDVAKGPLALWPSDGEVFLATERLRLKQPRWGGVACRPSRFWRRRLPVGKNQ